MEHTNYKTIKALNTSRVSKTFSKRLEDSGENKHYLCLFVSLQLLYIQFFE